jgi:hypothetical protein
VHEPVEKQALPAGKAELGRPHSLRVLSSEAVPNSFPTSTEFVPHQHPWSTSLEIGGADLFAAADYRSDVVRGYSMSSATTCARRENLLFASAGRHAVRHVGDRSDFRIEGSRSASRRTAR